MADLNWTWKPGDQLPEPEDILTEEELAECDAAAAKYPQYDPNDPEPDDEFDDLLELDEGAEVLAVVAGGAKK